MKKTRIQFIILLAVSAILIVIVGMRMGATAVTNRAEPAHTLSLTAAAAQPLQVTPSHRPVDEVDIPPPAPAATPTPTPEPTPEPTPTITPVEEQPAVGQPENGRYGQLLLTADEIETLARLVLLEAGGEPFEGQQAVAEVVLNRVLSPVYPNNVYDVVYDEGPQFSPASEIPYYTATQTQYAAVDAALRGPNILPQGVLYFATSMNGRTELCCQIGNHLFCY